jgi:hypothetical protein
VAGTPVVAPLLSNGLAFDPLDLAFSPDGSKLVIFGVAALFVADAKGGPTEKLTDQGGYGGLDWTK